MSDPLIAVVGVCAAGKTTLARALRELGYNARPVLQEHSYVPTMWQRITRPDVLIYLAADLETVRHRRRDPYFPVWLFEQELERLRHAREHADIYIDTSPLSPGEVLAYALAGLARLGYW
ncbi:MAG: hypothetical protein N2204_07010 [Anaerolineae bacterium]|nr:hypothetical protein [Anaerolineae bacterium]